MNKEGYNKYYEFPLDWIIEDFTVPQLKGLAYVLGYRFKSGVRKKEMVDHILVSLRKEPHRLVEGAFYYELKAFLDIIEGRLKAKYFSDTVQLFTHNRFGLVCSDIPEIDDMDKPVHLLFQKEVALLIRPLIPAELERRKKDGSLLIEQVALGMANLYGYTDLPSIYKYIPNIEEKLGRKLEEGVLTRMLYPILCDTQAFAPKSAPLVLLSPFAPINDFVPDQAHIDLKIEPKVFDIDTIIRYGQMPYPDFHIPAADKLRMALKKYGYSKNESTDDTLREIWINKNDEFPTSPLYDFDKFFNCSTEKQLNECISALVDFTNDVPYWRLRGHSSSEIGSQQLEQMRREGRMPNISIGPNMRAMGIESFDQILEMAARGEDFPFSNFPPNPFVGNVGRNDPCPCGSGKKYKHCCGK